MAEKEGYTTEVVHEGEDVVLRIDFERATIFPSLEDSPTCMSIAIEKLIQNPGVTKIVFCQKRDYEYSYEQTQLLIEIAKLYNKLIKQKGLLSYRGFGATTYQREISAFYDETRNLIYNYLKSDPVATYVELRRILRRENIRLEKAISDEEVKVIKQYISLLEYIVGLLEKTKLISLVKPYLPGYHIWDREIYRRVFSPNIKPDFMFAKLMASYPAEGEEIDSYAIGNIEVTIFKLPNMIQPLYHVMPPEFKLSEDKYEILDTARNIIAEHKPTREEFVDPERIRQVFFNIGHDLIEELANYRKIRLRSKEIDELTNILVRYTIGFGLIEVLLQDEKIQDVTINSPLGQSPMFIVHQDYDECRTNITPTITEGDSWASKLRMVSGRPLDEANPILDTELIIPKARARVAVVTRPLNPTGLAYAFRRHRDKPWTLPLFIQNRMISPLSAGLMSFLIDGARTILVAGTRSAGKTSLLGALMTEIMRKYRVITVEDTLELPVASLRRLGYNIQSMKVASAMTRGTTEVSADEGIRTTLRMGDSCLIVGEVRSVEARALYEAMRIGALANVVAGTIHGDSPYGVFDRVVNDLGVPRTSFKATDIIIVANPIKSPDGLHRWRRVTQITEVGKYWEQDPLLEKGFRDLMRYDSKTDQLEPTLDLINGDSDVLKNIAGNVKEWAGNWEAVWKNIQLRANMKETFIKYAEKVGMPKLLEADFVIQSNDHFHRISDSVKEKKGFLDNDAIFFEWNEWLKRAVKKMNIG